MYVDLDPEVDSRRESLDIIPTSSIWQLCQLQRLLEEFQVLFYVKVERIALVSSWFWCSFHCAFVCGYGVWARIALVPPWFWCSCSLLYVTSSARGARVGVWIRLMGMVSLVSPWSWCSCVQCQTLVCGYGLWARIG